MTDGPEPNQEAGQGVDWREITLSDGRYMIFYTFDDDGNCEDKNDQGEDV